MRKIILILIMLIGSYVYAQDPYFVSTKDYFPTTTFGFFSGIVSFDTGEYQNFGISLLTIAPLGIGLYLDGKWGYIDRYNGGVGVRLGDLIKIYGAVGVASVPYYPSCWDFNCATGLYVILPIRLGFQAGIDYSGFSKYDVEHPLVFNLGINYSF